jgi:hypothetical protein
MTAAQIAQAIPGQPVLASCLKDEGPFILEFVAHHLAVGFAAVLIASNDCTDGSDALLDALQEAGFAGHVRHQVKPGEMPQVRGFARLRRTFPIDTASWLMMLDTDEFLNIQTGAGRLADLLAEIPPEVDILALNWVNFGNYPHDEWQPVPVCDRFRHRLPRAHASNTPVKTLSRNPVNFGAIHAHHMMRFRLQRPIEVMRADRSRFSLPAEAVLYNHLRRWKPDEIRHGIAQVNHHPIKTYDSFLLRRARGRGGVPSHGSETIRHTDRYFEERAAAREQDDDIARYQAQTAEIIARMLAHPEVRAAQERCLAIYAERLAAL